MGFRVKKKNTIFRFHLPSEQTRIVPATKIRMKHSHPIPKPPSKFENDKPRFCREKIEQKSRKISSFDPKSQTFHLGEPNSESQNRRRGATRVAPATKIRHKLTLPIPENT